MCGILCSLSAQQHLRPPQEVLRRLRCRGPDSENTFYVQTGASPSHITLCSTVLSLRGSRIIGQPYEDIEGRYALCWNGEAWTIDSETCIEDDTAAIYQLLQDATNGVTLGEHSLDGQERAKHIARALSRVAGPYAFVFLDRVQGHLYFGRDFLGRRSLCWTQDSNGGLALSSVTDGDISNCWQEVETGGIYFVDINFFFNAGANISQNPSSARSLPVGACVVPHPFVGEGASVIPRLSLNKTVPSSQTPLTEASGAVLKLHALLRESLDLRVLNVPDPPSLESVHHRTKIAILFSGGLDCTVLARLCHDLLPEDEAIDLLNVAFENPRVHAKLEGDTDAAFELCPDRITGRASYAELQRVSSGREWRFVAVNVPYRETLEHRGTVISLMHPHNTEMDLSISYALYFAARGIGQITGPESGNTSKYTTPARVLLSGLGADELFGGYTRHATAFRRAGFAGLIDELELDLSRLGKRNLGRDDRVISHWGKEARFPFLDEKLLAWAVSAPVNDKCGFGEVADHLASGDSSNLEPGKKVLRCLAWRSGMMQVAKEKKRAIQFGARTAKMETGTTKGTALLS